MRKTLRWVIVAAIALAASWGQVARADVTNASATNVQSGDNNTDTTQSGSSSSGDAVAGQVTGVVSSGNTSVDATNKSDHVDIRTGNSSGSNSSSTFVGENASTDSAVAADVANGSATNVQDGDNNADISQDSTSTSGDGVGGQVIGVVTSAGGSAAIVAANTSEHVDIHTGNSDSSNSLAAFVGLNSASGTGVLSADVFNASATNVQSGDNSLDASQSATSASGDGVGGQVLGVVSAGNASVDATNSTDHVDIHTGNSSADNSAAAFVGLNASTDTAVAADIANNAATNVQDGDNNKDLSQSADASSGDAVAGEVAGVVTSAGGSADLVLANTSSHADTRTGNGTFDNSDDSFTGLNASSTLGVF